MKWTAVTILAFGSLIATNALHQDTTKEINPVPVKLMPPEGHVVLFKAMAEGAQIYVCKAKEDDPDRIEWVLKRRTPTCSTSEAGDRQALRRSDLGGARRWQQSDRDADREDLRTERWRHPLAAAQKEGRCGQGTVQQGDVHPAHRLEGGIAPARTCDKARQGQEVRVKYKATYVFDCAKE